MAAMYKPISVILADDHAMVREALARVLEANGMIRVVGQVGDGRSLLETFARERSDCVVMDYSMPHHNPVDTIKSILEIKKTTKILVLTVHENAHYAVHALQAGAHGYLIKSAAVEELVDAIKTVGQGDIYISRKISADVWSKLWSPKQPRSGLEALSPREFDVLRNLGSGLSIQDCAKAMNLSVSTISTYRSRLLSKLNLNSTNELVRFAVENNIIS
ncbi:MAG TPA: response regulator transcription factor [Pirellulaceae bacterium]|nr:response regulator transcription factor [Pirellulaceae bacterium]HMO92153.1 response regulator transcription factor [Pirellulaceae bacterium]HMP68921.1 response regulator transcription factor [Pirellulaceae bacterium]